MSKIVVGNWKMNPESFAEAKRIALAIEKKSEGQKKPQLVICPPSLYLSELKQALKGKRIIMGAQDLSAEKPGAHTGELSASMLKSAGAKYVIVGHSEVRENGETSKRVSEKLHSALQNDLIPILCIGEKKRDQEGGHYSFLSSELKESLSGVSKKDIEKILIAYEPVWAIGEAAKGAMEPNDLHETIIFLRRVISEIYTKAIAMNTTFLYGGSVDDRNAGAIIATGGVSGFLVGRASLDAEKFIKIASSIK